MLKVASVIQLLNRFKTIRYRFEQVQHTGFSENPGVFVNIPFCEKTCSFCPVYKTHPTEGQIELFLVRLLKEIEQSQYSGKVDWVHFSGGCPNLLTLEQLSSVITALRRKFSFSVLGIDLLPEKTDSEFFSLLKNLGFTHINTGIQSLSSQIRSLSAIHDSTRFPLLDFIKNAKTSGIFINAELLTGIPGTNADSLQFDLFQLLSVMPDQITVQPFLKLKPVSLNPVITDKEQNALIEWAADLLTGHGYHRSGIWTFSLTDDSYNIPVKQFSCDFVGFGPFAFTVSEHFYSVNPALPIYLDQSENRVLVADRSAHDADWGKFVSSVYELKLPHELSSDPILHLFTFWLKSSGHVKKKIFTAKGIKVAYTLVKSVFESLSLPLENTELIINREEYLEALENGTKLKIESETSYIHINPEPEKQ